jgi:hypothetical protein
LKIIKFRRDYVKKFEYKCIPILKMGRGTTEDLNRYGADGWELVCVWAFWHYLKREILPVN